MRNSHVIILISSVGGCASSAESHGQNPSGVRSTAAPALKQTDGLLNRLMVFQVCQLAEIWTHVLP